MPNFCGIEEKTPGFYSGND